ncbi:MAG: molybdenum cofactor biosynthesis protein MoaE [Deltaproteobacteria bacterium]|nr:molybdenum cofactor biosynthesis protein MoaE [Deltaproteobacteria bacterium]
MSLTAIRESPVRIEEAIAAVVHPGAGAVVSFVGTVRAESAGQSVARIEYHAYRAMAESELAALANEIEQEIPAARVAAIHRIGTLAVGEQIVACACSAPHRDDAFRAARLLIDRLKERVPIWKREHGPAGPYWVGWRDAREPRGSES